MKKIVLLVVTLLSLCMVACSGEKETSIDVENATSAHEELPNEENEDITSETSATPIEDFTYGYDSEAGGVKITGYNGTAMKVIIPEEIEGEPVVTICGEAFLNCSVMEVTLPKTLKIIDGQAFENCFGLMKIEFPESMEKIGYEAFMNCSALSELVIPDNVCTIGDQAFLGCSSVKKMVLPKNLEKIGEFAFRNCLELEEIIIPNQGKSIEIGLGAFVDCDAITNIVLPESVAKIGNDAFAACDKLESASILNSDIELGERIFSDCSSLKTVELPESLSVISFGMFDGCINLDQHTKEEIQKRAPELNWYDEFGFLVGNPYE